MYLAELEPNLDKHPFSQNDHNVENKCALLHWLCCYSFILFTFSLQVKMDLIVFLDLVCFIKTLLLFIFLLPF